MNGWEITFPDLEDPDEPGDQLCYNGVRGSVIYTYADPPLTYPSLLKKKKRTAASKSRPAKKQKTSLVPSYVASVNSNKLEDDLDYSEPDTLEDDYVGSGDDDEDMIYKEELLMEQDIGTEEFFERMNAAVDHEGSDLEFDSSDEEDGHVVAYEEEDYVGEGRQDEANDRKEVVKERKKRYGKVKILGEVKEPDDWQLPDPKWRSLNKKEKRQPIPDYWKPRLHEGESTPCDDPQLVNKPPGFAFYTKLEVFFMFFPLWNFTTIAKETNRRFEQKPPESETYRKRWVDTTKQMWVRFLGIMVLFCLSKQSRAELYWSRRNLCRINAFEATGISYHRFRLMKRYMHCQDVNHPICQPKRGESNHDPLALIRPLYDSFRVQVRLHVKPGRNAAIDERIIACKVQCAFRQKLLNKPTPNGIKVHVLATDGGLVIDIIIDDGMAYARRKWALNGEAIIMEFVDRNNLPPLMKLFFDRWYMSVQISRFLARPPHRIMTSGPCASGRKTFPRNTKKKKYEINVNVKKDMERGVSKMVVTDEALVCAIGWRDSIPYYHVSAGFRLCGDTVVRNLYKKDPMRKRIKEKTKEFTPLDTPIPCPPGIADYNHHMNKVLSLLHRHYTHHVFPITRTTAHTTAPPCMHTYRLTCTTNWLVASTRWTVAYTPTDGQSR